MIQKRDPYFQGSGHAHLVNLHQNAISHSKFYIYVDIFIYLKIRITDPGKIIYRIKRSKRYIAPGRFIKNILFDFWIQKILPAHSSHFFRIKSSFYETFKYINNT